MGLQPTTIRFPRDALMLVQRAAEQTGCTVAQFVREAALMRAVLTLESQRDAPQLADEIERLASALDPA
jgi:uncharacterized protein (DUF1778 family)